MADQAWDLNAELRTVTELLEARGLRYAVCGGMAVGLYCEPRGTIDLDLVVDPEEVETIVAALREIGFENFSAPMVFDGGEMIIHRVIKLQPGYAQVLMLDLCIPDKAKYPLVWKGWKRFDLGGYSLMILSRDGLIEMKKSRSSDKDMLDIKNLEEAE